MSEEFVGETRARLNSLEDKTKTHDKKISKLESYGESLVKLSTLLEMQMEVNKTQSETLRNINENLTGLNNAYKNLDERVETLEEYNSESKIDLLKLGKEVFFKVIPAIIIAYIIFKLGLKQ